MHNSHSTHGIYTVCSPEMCVLCLINFWLAESKRAHTSTDKTTLAQSAAWHSQESVGDEAVELTVAAGGRGAHVVSSSRPVILPDTFHGMRSLDQ